MDPFDFDEIGWSFLQYTLILDLLSAIFFISLSTIAFLILWNYFFSKKAEIKEFHEDAT